MDSLNPSSSLQLNDKEKAAAAEDSRASKRAQFYATFFRHQNFDFPDSIIYYITMNPATPNGYIKATGTCKYFFIKNPILVYLTPYHDSRKWYNYVQNWCENPVVKLKSKFWITDQFSCYSKDASNQSFLASIIPKFYRFNAKFFTIQNQILSYNDYAFLSSTTVAIHFRNVIIKDENGDNVALEKLVSVAAKAESFQFFSETLLTNITTETVKKLIKNPNFLKLKEFSLSNIPDTFDIEAFYDYIKTNKCTSIKLMFDGPISHVYKNRLDAITDEIVATKDHDYMPPLIYFVSINFEKYSDIMDLYSKSFA